MTRQEIIELLQDQVEHNRITAEELNKACDKHELDLHDNVLFPIGYNTCDRCGDYGDSELSLWWLDDFPWEDDNPEDQAILRALEQEGRDYCAICWHCAEELAKKGAIK